MYSFRRLVVLLAIASVAVPAAMAQSSSSSSSASDASQNPAAPTDQTQTQQTSQQQMSVQARIRLRRDQRRATAIHDTYDNLYEAYAGMGYLRFQPGKSLQRTTFYAWNTGLTRYYTERLGFNFDARGNYGIAFTGLQQGVTNGANTRPKISAYTLMFGPTYRIYLQPKYSISARVLGGVALSSFSGDTNGEGSQTFGIWPDGTTYAIAGSVIGQYNISPTVSLRLTGEDLATGFGSTMQNSVGFTGGFVYRFGKR